MLANVIPHYNILLNKLEDFRDLPGRFEEGKVRLINDYIIFILTYNF